MTSHSEHNSIAPSTPTLRSKIGNRSALHMTGADGQAVDGRSEFARAFRDVLGDIVNDLGGFDALEVIGKHAFGIPRDVEPRYV